MRASLLVFGSIVNIKFKNLIFTTREGWSAVLRNIKPNRVRDKDYLSPLWIAKVDTAIILHNTINAGSGKGA